MKTDKQTTESVWRHAICKEIAATGAVVFCISPGRFTTSGLPDRYVSSVIWSGWIEFKGRDTAVRTDQKIVCRSMTIRNPGSVFFVRFPNIIETNTARGIVQVATFDGTGRGLLNALQTITREIQGQLNGTGFATPINLL